MPTVNYSASIPYRAVPNMKGLQPALEVVLFNGEVSINAVGILDSGSLFTVFSPEVALALGIENVSDGRHDRISTLGGSRDIFFFDLEIKLSVAGNRFGAQIAFFAEHAPRNILGRSVIFSAFELGFHEKAGRINLRPDA